MRVYVFAEKGALSRVVCGETGITDVLERVAGGTDTRGLVVAVYLLRRRSTWEAHSLTEPVVPQEFSRAGGEWDFVERFGTPDDLPGRFPFIRIAIGLRKGYPLTETDIYGWEMTFDGFEAHLAYTFAHELHHFRRYGLGMHPGEGEQSACKWALARVSHAGFGVRGIRLPARRRRKKKEKPVRLPAELRPTLLRRIKLSAAHLSAQDLRNLARWIRSRLEAVRKQERDVTLEERFERLRSLPEGTRLVISGDDEPGGRIGQTAVKVRNLKRNSPRMMIRTSDGQEWLWPMEWLEPEKAPRRRLLRTNRDYAQVEPIAGRGHACGNMPY